MSRSPAAPGAGTAIQDDLGLRIDLSHPREKITDGDAELPLLRKVRDLSLLRFSNIHEK